jgi:hypothetical protein
MEPMIKITEFLSCFKKFRDSLNEFNITSSFNTNLNNPLTRLRMCANDDDESPQLGQFIFDLLGTCRMEMM